jgi:hypothetical protein
VLRDLAVKTSCAVVFAIHTTKESSKHKESVAGDMNIGRGASSIIGAVRVGYTLIRVSKKTLEDVGLPTTTDMVRLTGGKGNYSAHGTNDNYFRVIVVPIGNGTPEPEFSNPNDPGFMDPNDRSRRPSDTVGVLEWFDMAAAERAAQGVAVAKQDTLVTVIARSMPADRCPVGAVVDAVKAFEKCEHATAHARIRTTIPETDNGVKTIIDGRACVLRRKRKGHYERAPVELIREWEV